jgi:hypothetical protein
VAELCNAVHKPQAAHQLFCGHSRGNGPSSCIGVAAAAADRLEAVAQYHPGQRTAEQHKHTAVGVFSQQLATQGTGSQMDEHAILWHC